MFISMFKSKLHRATVTDADIDYVGSITIDADLLEASDILPGEKVQVVNINNGARFETYTLTGQAGSGVICVNGAAARLVQKGDLVIIISYATMDREEAASFSPTICILDENNKLTGVKHNETPGKME
jgi:aspartate 1-decarboxylase